MPRAVIMVVVFTSVLPWCESAALAGGPRVTSPADLAAIPTLRRSAGDSVPELEWPVCTEQIAGFGEGKDPWSGTSVFHAGFDFTGDYNTPVYAGGSGTVLAAGRQGAYGLMIELDHGGGLGTRYAQLSSMLAHPGMRVAAGEPIGRVGSSGRSKSPHLHFEAWQDGKVQNPAEFLATKPDCSRLNTGNSAPIVPFGRFAWPVCGPITSTFGYRLSIRNEFEFHAGVDLGDRAGLPVRAAAKGRVVAAEKRDEEYGLVIEIDHGKGFRTRYGHLEAAAVSPAQMVSRGQVIGAVGATGSTQIPTLHFEVWWNNVVRDAVKHLERDAACNKQGSGLCPGRSRDLRAPSYHLLLAPRC